MSSFIVEGKKQLKGEITPKGAKNEALQVICATLLTSETVIINNVPDILDIRNLIKLMIDLGVKVEKLAPEKYSFTAEHINEDYVSSPKFIAQCAKLRGSIMVISPLLYRLGYVYYAAPGGDKIGRRRLDTHFKGICALGAKLSNTTIENENAYKVTRNGRLVGTYMLLDEASVTGTANIILSAVCAEGKTTIYNAACEPYIQQLCRMLKNMGAKISGIGSNLLTIQGVESLHGTKREDKDTSIIECDEAHNKGWEHTILPDMIEIGSFIGMAVMTNSEITIKNVSWDNLGIIPDSFRKLGVKLIKRGDDMYIPHHDHYEIETFMDGSILTIADSIWPGLTPDLLSVILLVATQARGSVLIHQKMFESRLFFVDKLIDMGAKIILCDPHRAVVIGHDRSINLRANQMVSPDIRAGIVMLIAAMSADGISKIDHIEQIDRGYADIENRLNSLGANIKRIDS